MNWIQKTYILIGFVIVFLFAFSANKVPVHQIQMEDTESSFSVDRIHKTVFIQPQATVNIATNQKTPVFLIAKYLENFLVIIPDLKVNSVTAIFGNQDINRCEMVSLLLFPFHVFW